MKIITLFSILMLSTSVFAVSQPTSTPLLQCLPSANTSLFGFTISEVNGCELAPSGPQCGDSLSISILHYDVQAKSWTLPGLTGSNFAKTAIINKAAGTFEYHDHVTSPLATSVDISVNGPTTSVNIKWNAGDSFGRVDTNGVQTSYVCEFL